LMCDAVMIHPYRMTEPAQSSTAEDVQNALFLTSSFVTLSFQETPNMHLSHL